MKIIIDNKIPFIEGVFEPLADVVYAPGADFDAAMAKDTDALITRTRTQCNAETLVGSKVKFIATATIGYDHIDTEFCAHNDIQWKNAPGCNADAVVQYVFAALGELLGDTLSGKTLGVVGVGNVGSRVASFAERLGMHVLRNDPPRQDAEGDEGFASLEEVMQQSDIITFHTPLTQEVKYPTYHLCDETFLSGLSKKAVIINASRGGVCSSVALLAAKKASQISHLVLDCWENEPAIDMNLFPFADIATFHIAGYSLEGKANATSMAIQAVSRFFDLGFDDYRVALPKNESQCGNEKTLLGEVVCSYPIMNDDKAFRAAPDQFENLRGSYQFRRQPDCL